MSGGVRLGAGWPFYRLMGSVQLILISSSERLNSVSVGCDKKTSAEPPLTVASAALNHTDPFFFFHLSYLFSKYPISSNPLRFSLKTLEHWEVILQNCNNHPTLPKWILLPASQINCFKIFICPILYLGSSRSFLTMFDVVRCNYLCSLFARPSSNEWWSLFDFYVEGK